MRNIGTTILTARNATSAISGTTEKMIMASFALRKNAMIVPPTSMMGAEMIIRMDCKTKSCITFTSLVQRVISEGVPMVSISLCESVSTLRNSFSRKMRL